MGSGIATGVCRIDPLIFPVRLCNAHTIVDRFDIESLLQGGQPFLGHLDGGIVQFMFKHDMAMLCIGAVLACVDPAFKVTIHSIPGQVTATITRHIPV